MENWKTFSSHSWNPKIYNTIRTQNVLFSTVTFKNYWKFNLSYFWFLPYCRSALQKIEKVVWGALITWKWFSKTRICSILLWYDLFIRLRAFPQPSTHRKQSDRFEQIYGSLLRKSKVLLWKQGGCSIKLDPETLKAQPQLNSEERAGPRNCLDSPGFCINTFLTPVHSIVKTLESNMDSSTNFYEELGNMVVDSRGLT